MPRPTAAILGAIGIALVAALLAGLQGEAGWTLPGTAGPGIRLPVPALVAGGVLAGMLLGLLAAWWLRGDPPPWQAPPPAGAPPGMAATPLPGSLPPLAAALGLVAAAAALFGSPDVARVLAALVLLAAAAGCALWLVRLVAEGETVELRSHWGGLGGGLGGWRASPAAVLLVMALGLAGAAVAVLPSRPGPEPPKPPAPAAPAPGAPAPAAPAPAAPAAASAAAPATGGR